MTATWTYPPPPAPAAQPLLRAAPTAPHPPAGPPAPGAVRAPSVARTPRPRRTQSTPQPVPATSHRGELAYGHLLGGSALPSALDVDPRLLTHRARRPEPSGEAARKALLAPFDDHDDDHERRRHVGLAAVGGLASAVVAGLSVVAALA